MFQHLPSRQAACYHHTLSDELVADQVNDMQRNFLLTDMTTLDTDCRKKLLLKITVFFIVT